MKTIELSVTRYYTKSITIKVEVPQNCDVEDYITGSGKIADQISSALADETLQIDHTTIEGDYNLYIED